MTNDQMMTRVQKADLSLSFLVGAGGAMNEGYAEKFIRLMIKKSKIMKDMTVIGMKEYSRKIPTIKFGSRVLKPGTAGQALPSGDRARPDFTAPVLNARLFKAAVVVEDEVFEDNIEADALRNTLLQMLGEAIARDTEYVVVAGDTTSGTPLLAVLDGIVKQASSHTVDAAGARLSSTLLKSARKALPHEYKDDPKNMKFWTSTNAADDYADSLAQRATEMGDKYMEQYVADPPYRSIPVIGVPEMPEDYTTNKTVALLCNPTNVVVGFHKKVEIRTQEDVESG
jgi:hypothetical protein